MASTRVDVRGISDINSCLVKLEPLKRPELADLKRDIEDFIRRYKWNSKVKNLLKPFKVEKLINIIRKVCSSDILVKVIGDKVTEKISKRHKKIYSVEEPDMVICMVELFLDGEVINVKRESLNILKNCLLSWPSDTEILIECNQGIHAIEAKYIVFESLSEIGINRTRAVYHFAETDFEDIVVQRVIAAIQHIQQDVNSLCIAFPEFIDIKAVSYDAFNEHITDNNLRETVNDIILMDGDTRIGNVNDGEVKYRNGYKVYQIKNQLSQKTSKALAQQICGSIENQIKDHFSNKLTIEEHASDSLVAVDETNLREELLKVISIDLEKIRMIVLAVILTLFAILFEIPYMVVTVFIFPVNVNDPEWRYGTVRNSIHKVREKEDEILSKTIDSLHSQFNILSKAMKPLTRKIQNPLTPGYDATRYHKHRYLKSKCKSKIKNEMLTNHVKKIVIGEDEKHTRIYLTRTEETESNIERQNTDCDIEFKVFGQSTEEERRIHEYLIQNKPKIQEHVLNKIKKVISNEANNLFTMYSNLFVIGPSPVKSSLDGFLIEAHECIVLFCIGKGHIPIGEPSFPKKLFGIDIDVREGVFSPFCCINCSLGKQSVKSTGSQGFLVHEKGKSSETGIITAAHVVVGGHVLCKDISIQRQYVFDNRPAIVSPSDEDASTPADMRLYGNVCDIYFGNSRYGGVDAAFVKKMKGSQVNLDFHIQEGTLSTPVFNIHHPSYNPVRKCGRTANGAFGYFLNHGMDCKWEYEPNSFFVILQNQYKVISNQANVAFFKPGDSGSGVYLVENRNCHPFGIAIASTNENGNVCFVTPIRNILDILQLDIHPAEMEY